MDSDPTGIENDAYLSVIVGRLIRSIEQLQDSLATELVNDIVSLTYNLHKKNPQPQWRTRETMVMDLFNMTPQNDADQASTHLRIFTSSFVLHELVMLYMSSDGAIREAAYAAIKEFTITSKSVLPYDQCAQIIFELFCKLHSKAGKTTDPLYCLCMSTLQAMVECCECVEIKGMFSLQLFFARGLVAELADDFNLCTETTSFTGPPPYVVRGFTEFLDIVRIEIEGNSAHRYAVAIPSCGKRCGAQASYTKDITYLHGIFLALLSKLENCLAKIEDHDYSVKKHNNEGLGIRNCKYFCLMECLDGISKVYIDWEEAFMETLMRRNSALSRLIFTYVKRDDDYNWILKYKELIKFEDRRHLAMMMLPEILYHDFQVEGEFELEHESEVEDESEVEGEFVISRSHLLAESFEYITHADPQSLRAGLCVKFKNEKATGHGVLREWFFLVCQELVNPLNSLFLACPNDCRRFFPNPASRVDSLHLEYFSFCGRVIALALMHNVQVGIVFDRVFFLQLAGYSISLEDIQDTDPFLYRSCKQILDMDPEVVDQDALGLTFVHEVEEMGTKKVFELCPGGRSMVVNSKNRNQFVDSLIKHRFVTANSKQVAHFARGFSDIMNYRWPHMSFFRCLDLEDLDWMLHGSESAISVDDWKAHTVYRGFKETDIQISWFWEIVGHMLAEQKRALLFFWTSIKYLPVEGFSGLVSPLRIDKTAKSHDRLPSSHTCFNQLHLPDYSSFDVMRDHLNIITQEHVGCSFGKE